MGEVKAIKGAALHQRLSRRAAYVVSVRVNDARMLFLGKRAQTHALFCRHDHLSSSHTTAAVPEREQYKAGFVCLP